MLGYLAGQWVTRLHDGRRMIRGIAERHAFSEEALLATKNCERRRHGEETAALWHAPLRRTSLTRSCGRARPLLALSQELIVFGQAFRYPYEPTRPSRATRAANATPRLSQDALKPDAFRVSPAVIPIDSLQRTRTMTQTAAFLTTLVFIVLAALAADSLRFLAPFRALLFSRHGHLLLAYSAMLAVNVFVLFVLVLRGLALRQAGDKLRHLEGEGVLAEEIDAMTARPTDRQRS